MAEAADPAERAEQNGGSGGTLPFPSFSATSRGYHPAIGFDRGGLTRGNSTHRVPWSEHSSKRQKYIPVVARAAVGDPAILRRVTPPLVSSVGGG